MEVTPVSGNLDRGHLNPPSTLNPINPATYGISVISQITEDFSSSELDVEDSQSNHLPLENVNDDRVDFVKMSPSILSHCQCDAAEEQSNESHSCVQENETIDGSSLKVSVSTAVDFCNDGSSKDTENVKDCNSDEDAKLKQFEGSAAFKTSCSESLNILENFGAFSEDTHNSTSIVVVDTPHDESLETKYESNKLTSLVVDEQSSVHIIPTNNEAELPIQSIHSEEDITYCESENGPHEMDTSDVNLESYDEVVKCNSPSGEENNIIEIDSLEEELVKTGPTNEDSIACETESTSEMDCGDDFSLRNTFIEGDIRCNAEIINEIKSENSLSDHNVSANGFIEDAFGSNINHLSEKKELEEHSIIDGDDQDANIKAKSETVGDLQIIDCSLQPLENENSTNCASKPLIQPLNDFPDSGDKNSETDKKTIETAEHFEFNKDITDNELSIDRAREDFKENLSSPPSESDDINELCKASEGLENGSVDDKLSNVVIPPEACSISVPENFDISDDSSEIEKENFEKKLDEESELCNKFENNMCNSNFISSQPDTNDTPLSTDLTYPQEETIVIKDRMEPDRIFVNNLEEGLANQCCILLNKVSGERETENLGINEQLEYSQQDSSPPKEHTASDSSQVLYYAERASEIEGNIATNDDNELSSNSNHNLNENSKDTCIISDRECTDNTDNEITTPCQCVQDCTPVEAFPPTFLPTITEEREDLSLLSLKSGVNEKKTEESCQVNESRGDLTNTKDVPKNYSKEIINSCFELVVDNVVSHIPQLYLLMQDNQFTPDEMEETTSEMTEAMDNRQSVTSDEIVMMNDEESFVTVVHDSTADESAVLSDSFCEDSSGNLKHPFSGTSAEVKLASYCLEKSQVPPEKKFKRRLSLIIERGFSKCTKNDYFDVSKLGLKSHLFKYGSSESLVSPESVKKVVTNSVHDNESDNNVPPVRFHGGAKKKFASSRRKMFKKSNGDSSTDQKSFGKRSQGGGRRPNECLILETSGTIAIDYPHVELIHPGQRPPVTSSRALNNFLALEHHSQELSLKGASWGAPGGVCNVARSNASPPPHYVSHHPSHDLPDLLRGSRSRGSVGSSVRDGSDTSSAYSGSDTMCQSVHSLDHEDVDLSGLMESAVDSDEEDLAESVESLSVRDAVRECLEKDPSERSEDDIKVLLEFTERLAAFSNMTVAVRRAMCQSMVFAVVDEAGTVLMNDHEELDSWSVIINGHVEVTHSDGGIDELHLGDSFGITPTMEKLYHSGVMRSKVPDCQFVCIRQSDYYRILHQGEENTKRIEEDGVLVLVTEQRHIEACDRKGHIVIKGTPERLMQQLVEVANELDPTYVEDFLLTHRTFIENPLTLANKLLDWFRDSKHQDHVTRVILRWVQSHFTDFEMDPRMMNFLEQFEEGLERKNMTGQLLLLRVACMTKARNRLVTLTRPSRDDPLQFKIVGDKDGIFILSVEKGSKAEEVGLKRADQILEVNSQSFDKITKAKALEILTSACHLAITVKSNLHTFSEMLKEPEHCHRQKNWMASELTSNGTCHSATDFMSTLNLNAAPQIHNSNNKKEEKVMSMTLKAYKLKERFLASIGTKTSIADTPSDDSVSSHSSLGGPLYRSRSNPDLSTSGYDESSSSRSEFPDHVLKIYRATDQSTRFVPVHKETTAREVVMLSLPLFNITEPSCNYALFEVSVTEQGVAKQKRLSPDLKNLAERIGLSSRYYLRSVKSSQNLCPDEVINELIRESQVNVLQLNSVELAIQLSLEDFTIFRQIEPTEYVDDLFKLKSKYGTPALSKFEDISNKELYWVCTEVCSEHNLVKRAKIIKQFIKIAKHCKDIKNFNSMFAILSGLGNGCVQRLRQTWARVSNRYRRMFSELETFMDPSRNMSKYRNLINCESSQSPMIPFFPIAKKDLTFHNEGNDDKVDGLINFEKLRTISRSIRELGHMCSSRYDPNKMLEQLGQPLNSAMTAMNQGITGSSQISTVKRRKKSTAQPDKKKMFEEAQMVRRVKAYLNQFKVIRDENILLKASYECEPPASGSTIGSHMTLSMNSSGSSSCSGQNGSNSAPSTNPQTRKRANSPTPSTASSTSSTSHTSDGKKPHARFGAASPTSERKMMALAETTKKPYHGPRHPSSTNTLTLNASLSSPNPSPGALRRGPVLTVNVPNNSTRGNHERSHSDTPVNSVDLSAESSSVTSLSSFTNLKKSLTSGSVTSQDCHGSQGETDSGISTQFDCNSSSSLEVELGANTLPYDGHYHSSSPHNPQRRFSHQPVCGGRHVRRGASGCPPDYTSTQMRQFMGRALSHDGVHYYRYRHEEDDDEGRVSAV